MKQPLKAILATLTLALGSPVAFAEKATPHQFSFGGPDNSEFLLDGKPFQIIGGKLGNICTPPDTSVYAELAWPEGATSVEVTVEAGDDTLSNAWGPGLALMSPAGNLSVNARPGSGKFDVGQQVMEPAYDRTKPCHLRVRLDLKRKTAYFDFSQDGENFKLIGTSPCRQAPTALRVGKVGHEGVGTDYKDAAATPLIHSKITRVVVRGN